LNVEKNHGKPESQRIQDVSLRHGAEAAEYVALQLNGGTSGSAAARRWKRGV
jgi:hypothetical protein